MKQILLVIGFLIVSGGLYQLGLSQGEKIAQEEFAKEVISIPYPVRDGGTQFTYSYIRCPREDMDRCLDNYNTKVEAFANGIVSEMITYYENNPVIQNNPVYVSQPEPIFDNWRRTNTNCYEVAGTLNCNSWSY